MTAIRGFLFQNLRITTIPDSHFLDLGSPTTRSLIAYLLLNRSRPTDRRRLAFVFWPRANESAARRNLRQYIHHIRTALDPLNADGTLLQVDGSSIQFNPLKEISLDVEIFQEYARSGASKTELEQALDLYTGDLLEDVYDDWCIDERERLHQIWLDVLDRYSLAQQQAGRLSDALSTTQKWINAEPFDENAIRRLMQICALSGDRARAIQTYQAFAELLDKELEAEPLPETQSLLQAIQSGQTFNETISAPPVQVRRQASVSLPSAPIIPPHPFIGRQKEIRLLDDAYQSAAQGAGKLVLITGEAGIGKTRLLQEYLGRHPDIAGLHSASYELESMVPFAPLRQALDTPIVLDTLLRRTSSQTPPLWVSNLIAIIPELNDHFQNITPASLPGDVTTVRDSLINLFVYLSENCQSRPLHLILDDLHWADSPTWELLAFLTRRVVSLPLLIIGLFREEDLPAERLPLLRTIKRSDLLWTIELPRFTPNETADLARYLTPKEAGNPILAQRLYQETEGNPFFIVETVHILQETGSLQKPLPITSMPNSIQRVIEARLDRLSAPSREALSCAAAIGRSFSYPLLQEILQVDSEEIITFIEGWQQRGLIHEGKLGYDFRHDKIRQVAYVGLGRARREFIHGRIANVLENTIPHADVTTLAHHYSRSDQPLKALPYLTQAGEQALSLRSYHEARQFGLQAVNLLGHLPGPRQRSERIDINLQLAQAYAYTGDMQRAIEILHETEQHANAIGDEQRLGQIFRRASQFFWLRGQAETSSDYARRTLRVAEELGNDELLYAALRMLGRVSIALAAFDDAIAYLVRYVNIHDELAESDPQAHLPEDLPIVLGYLGVAYSRVGAWERSYESAQRGLEMAASTSGNNLDARSIFARMQLAMVYAGRHNWQQCLEVLEPIPDPTDLEEITPPLYMVLSLRGYALVQTGQEDGIQLIQNAVDWAKRTGHRVFHYLPRYFLAESLLLNKELDSARQEAMRVLKEARQSGNRWAVGVTLKLISDIETRLPSPAWTKIESDLIESMHLLRQVRARPDLARTYLSLRRLYDRAGQIAWAVDCHFRATTIFDELRMDEELRSTQGHAAHDRYGAVVIPNLPLRGPNVGAEEFENEKNKPM